MRVLIVTNMYPTSARPALGAFVRDQVEALGELDGIELELFTFRAGGAAAYARAAVELRRRFARRRFDVVHAHYGLSGWVALALPRTPHVVTFHGTDLEHPVVGRLSRLLARIVALPAPASGALARQAGLADIRAGRRLAVLPCGVNLERLRPIEKRAARERLGLDDGARYLLFPADPARREKRHDRAAAVADALGAHLLSYKDVHPDEVPYLINASNAVVAPSEREGFGLAPLESLACNIPVAATDVGIAPVALAGVPSTLCAPFDLERWTAAIRPHVEQADSRIEGRAHAALFERRRLAGRVATAYRDLASSPL